MKDNLLFYQQTTFIHRAFYAMVSPMKAPNFTLLDENQKAITLTNVLTQGAALLVFYPGDFTPVCTSQLCSYRDHFEDFLKLDLQLLGISQDDSQSHLKFRSKYNLPFHLLSDPGHKVAKEFGCSSIFMLGFTSRAVFIIGRDQEILYKHVEALAITHRKSDELLKAAQSLKEKGMI